MTRLQHSFLSKLPQKYLLLLGVAATALCANAAFAQDKQIDEIVATGLYVAEGSDTATKANIPLIRTPQSISVITREQIDLLNFIDAQQAVRYTAGAFGENYGPDLRFDFVTVRGFTPQQYIDGLAAPVSTSIRSVGLDLYAFESMDILKGPASALYGSSPPGGLYNQTSRRPDSEFGGEVSVKYGTDDYKQIAGTITGAIGSNENISARMTALYLDRGAERDFVTADRLLLAPSLKVDLSPDTQLTALAYFQKDHVNGDTNGFLPVFGTLLPNPNGQIDPSTNLGDPNNLFERDQWSLGYDFSHHFSDALSFSSNTKVSDYAEESPTVIYGGGGLIDADFDGTPDDFRTVQQYNFSYKEDVKSFATDNRLNLDVDTGDIGHGIIAGLDYRTVENEASFGFIFAGQIDAFNPVFPAQTTLEPGFPSAFNDQKLKQTGIYVQDHVEINNLYLTLSGRYDDIAITDNASGLTTDQSEFTYRVGANYVFESGIAPYASYATSFEPVLGTDSVTNNPFKPSKGDQLEAGIKWNAANLPDGYELLLSGAVYKISQSNVVSTVPSVTPVFGTQIGEVEVQGFELELVSRINKQLAINASYGLTDSDVTKSTTPVEIGSQLPVTPKHKASIFADYSFLNGSMKGLGIGAGVRYTGESQGALLGAFTPVVYTGQASTLVDAVIRYDLDDWRFSVNGSNVFGKEYVARCAGPAGCTYGAGRQVIATIVRHF
ncbi:MAG: TonB-dependent siderophore receptor [Alphaproteobacteria bacterium]